MIEQVEPSPPRFLKNGPAAGCARRRGRSSHLWRMGYQRWLAHPFREPGWACKGCSGINNASRFAVNWYGSVLRSDLAIVTCAVTTDQLLEVIPHTAVL